MYADYLAKIGEGLGMPQGSLRTFLPGVQPGDLIDARRHRVLTAATLLRGYDEEQGRFHPALARTIARTPREYLWDNGLDKELPPGPQGTRPAQGLNSNLPPPGGSAR